MRILHASAAAALTFITTPGPALLAQSTPTPSAWQVVVTPSWMAPVMRGRLIIKGYESESHAGAGDAFSPLQTGAGLGVEVRRGDWGFTLDGLYTNVSQPAERTDDRIRASQLLLTAVAAKRAATWLEFRFGARLNATRGTITGTLASGGGVEDKRVWLDPVIGAGLVIPGTGHWDIGLSGNVGGFGLGSDFAWQVYPRIGFRFSHGFQAHLGYRAVGFEFEVDQTRDRYGWHLRTFGPVLGARLTF